MKVQTRSKSSTSAVPKKNLFYKFFIIFLSLGTYQLLNRIGYGFSSISKVFLNEKYAYATLLCDDQMAEAAMVLVHSVKRTGSPHDFVILTLNVSNQTITALKNLGAIIHPITNPVPYPFPATASRKLINKPCRYSKLLIWDLIQYNKIIYLDADLLVIQNIDELFDRPQLTAVADVFPPDKFNSGVMVIVPDRRLFLDMLDKISVTSSPNVGDQGFLNNYFNDWFSLPSIHHLDASYNALIRLSTSLAWKEFIQPNLKILHYSGSTKPWNMMHDRHMPTTRQYDHVWWRMHHDMVTFLYKKLNDKSIFINHELVSEQCRYDYMQYKRQKKVVKKLSIIINSFDRFDLLQYMIQKYAKMKFVHKIYIIWGNTHITPYPPSFFRVSIPVEIIYTGIDSLNDRFRPIKSLETEAVLICDDDIEVNEFALESAFNYWLNSDNRNNNDGNDADSDGNDDSNGSGDKYRLIGFFPRGHYTDQMAKKYHYLPYPKGEYSIVLTKMFLMHADYLRMYTCHLPIRLHVYVDENKNCEDIAMNFLASYLSSLPPLVMEDVFKKDYGTTSGLSSRKKHHASRSDCLNDFAQMLGYFSLRNTSDTLTYIQKLPKKMTSLDDIIDMQPVVNKDGVFLQDIIEDDADNNDNNTENNNDLKHSRVTFAPSIFSGMRHLCLASHSESKVPTLYALRTANEISFESKQLSGSTLLLHLHSSTNDLHYTNMIQLLSDFAYYHRHHNNGCFGFARILLLRKNEIVKRMDEWTSLLFRAAFGQHAKTLFELPQLPSLACFEKAMVVKQKEKSNSSNSSGNGSHLLNHCDEEEEEDGSSSNRKELRNVVRSFCKMELKKNKTRAQNMAETFYKTGPKIFRISVIGKKNAWKKIAWFDFFFVKTKILALCNKRSWECQISKFFPKSLCHEQVLGEKKSDLFILTSQNDLKFLQFLDTNVPILQIWPKFLNPSSSSHASKNCFPMNLQPLKYSEGKQGLLKKIIENLNQIEHVSDAEKNYFHLENTCLNNQEID